MDETLATYVVQKWVNVPGCERKKIKGKWETACMTHFKTYDAALCHSEVLAATYNLTVRVLTIYKA
jgi:hypothetical protein